MTRTSERPLLFFTLLMLLLTCYLWGHEARKVEILQAAMSESNILATCFPNHHYKADAAPTCPAFKKQLFDEMNKDDANER